MPLVDFTSLFFLVGVGPCGRLQRVVQVPSKSLVCSNNGVIMGWRSVSTFDSFPLKACSYFILQYLINKARGRRSERSTWQLTKHVLSLKEAPRRRRRQSSSDNSADGGDSDFVSPSRSSRACLRTQIWTENPYPRTCGESKKEKDTRRWRRWLHWSKHHCQTTPQTNQNVAICSRLNYCCTIRQGHLWACGRVAFVPSSSTPAQYFILFGNPSQHHFQICYELRPLDLLTLSRVCTTFRSLLHGPSSTIIRTKFRILLQSSMSPNRGLLTSFGESCHVSISQRIITTQKHLAQHNVFRCAFRQLCGKIAKTGTAMKRCIIWALGIAVCKACNKKRWVKCHTYLDDWSRWSNLDALW